MFRKGFSLIEVNMAILIAAGGLLSLFTLFPTGLRQSEMSSEDLYQSTYASSILQMITGNISTIDNIESWNDTDGAFWRIAVDGTDIPNTLLQSTKALTKIDKEVRDQYLDFTTSGSSTVKDHVWYTGSDISNKKSVSLPEQYIIRVLKKKDTNPAVYVISVVCTSIKAPAIYYQNSVYSAEFAFYGKVWAQPPEGEAE